MNKTNWLKWLMFLEIALLLLRMNAAAAAASILHCYTLCPKKENVFKKKCTRIIFFSGWCNGAVEITLLF